jgi:hypothetical protein
MSDAAGLFFYLKNSWKQFVAALLGYRIDNSAVLGHPHHSDCTITKDYCSATTEFPT